MTQISLSSPSPSPSPSLSSPSPSPSLNDSDRNRDLNRSAADRPPPPPPSPWLPLFPQTLSLSLYVAVVTGRRLSDSLPHSLYAAVLTASASPPLFFTGVTPPSRHNGGGSSPLSLTGNKTDLVICSYDDHFLVIATQIGSMGTILHARKEEGMLIQPTFNVSVICGKRDEPMLVACARQLIENISSSGSSRPLVLSLGLKDHSVETLKGIVHAVVENRLW